MGTGEPTRSPRAIVHRAGRVPLIGRDSEIALLHDALATAQAGEPRVVFLAGEAGIGKTRLIDETARTMTERGGRVAIGRCLDERGMPPYLPWLNVISALERIGRSSSAPTLSEMLTGVDHGQSSISPESRRLRLFDGVVDAIGSAAADAPLLIVFDDLQWSDESSNQLLRYVASRLSPSPVLILGAYRAEETGSNAELTRTLDELDRRRHSTTIRLGPLPPSATARIVAELTGEHDQDLALAIHRRSDGNPFHIEELVRALAEQGRSVIDGHGALSLPRGVTAVIERRLDGVTGNCRAILEFAAVGGREIAVDLVAGAAEHDPEQVAALLDEAVRTALVQIVSPAGAPGVTDAAYAFAHDRVRETIVAGLNPVRRRAIHARIADAIATMGETDDLAHLAMLTHHLQQARAFVRAANASARLGDAAMRAHAFDEAARAYALAIELAPGRDAAEVAGLWMKQGEALLAAGHDALASFAAAERAFRAIGDQLSVARSLHRQGTALARREQHDLALTSLNASLAIREQLPGAEGETAAVLTEIGSIMGLSLGRYPEALAAGRRALTLLSPAEAPGPAADAHLALGNTLIRSGDLAAGNAELEAALALAVRAGNPDLAAEVAGALAAHRYWIGDLDAAERFARRRRELAVEAGDRFALRHTHPWLANMALARGEWGTALTLIAEAEREIARLDSPEPRAFLDQLTGLIALARGNTQEAIRLLERAITAFRPSGPPTLSWYIGCLAYAHHAAGDHTTAAVVRAETESVIAALPDGALPRAPSLALLGIIAAQSGDRGTAGRWYGELLPYTGQHHWVLVDRVLGMLAATLGDRPAADGHFSAAATQALRGGIRPEYARTLAEQALARHVLSPGPENGQAMRESVARLSNLGMSGEANRMSTLIADRSTARSYPAGLSEREVAVLTLLAQGLTNREIGDRLGIAEKTVTNHLTHIFTKADLDNRAAAVAFALRHGLAT